MSAIKDNYMYGSVGEFLKDKIQDNAKLSFVSAFFTIYAYDKLKEKLNSINSLDFLFGEPRFIQSLDPNKSETKTYHLIDSSLEIKNSLQQKAISKECSSWIQEKVNIRSIKETGFLHGKMYHINNNGVEEAILGSSNFTVRGLGLNEHPNIELNLEVNDKRDKLDLKEWFGEIWNNDELTSDVKQNVIDYLEQLYIDNPPEFIYFKTLYHIFEKYLGEQDKTEISVDDIKIIDTRIWKILYEFQKDGAKGIINKLNSHNGCILADSVGLGKTYTALAVIKYFELRNFRVLVLCPKRLRENWTVYQVTNVSKLNPFLEDKFNYTVFSHTDLSRDKGKVGDLFLEKINWSNFDLVVIDESHNFRNNTKGKKDEEGNIIKKSRYERLMEDIIKMGVRSKVLLLSATPVNINLRDLRNQINIITAEEYSAFVQSLKISNYSELFKVAQRQFTEWAKKKDKTFKDLLERMSSSFFTILDELTIARSRKHIKKYYDITKIGIFPYRNKPISIYSDIDTEGKFLTYDELNNKISDYQLSLYNPSKYILEEYKVKYKGKIKQFTQSDREYFLIGMMKINFLKRLESSIESFQISMSRTIEKIKQLETKLNEFIDRLNDGNIEIEDYIDKESDDPELEEAMQVGSKTKFNLAHLKVKEWLIDLNKDKEQISNLFHQSSEVTVNRDAKLIKLKELIELKINNPTKNREGKVNHKILIFTAFADTAIYLYNALNKWVKNDLNTNIAIVTGGSSNNKTTYGNNNFNNILTNFSPISKERDKILSMDSTEEIDVLIATDCISEGQNLQDCDYLINYDIHWNPVKIIQRFGRIDRIGSLNDNIQLINFWPTKNLDNYIQLKNRVESRMALVDITATTEDNILNQDEIKDLISEDLKYRDKQLIRLKDEIIDMEDFNEGINLSDFTLDDFRIELLKYIEANRDKLENASYGLYAVVPLTEEYKNVKPGVIFCLKYTGDAPELENVNPVHLYYLLYVQDDGEVRFKFANTKQILEMFRNHCSGKDRIYTDLCNLFNSETDQGRKMDNYNNWLDKGVKETISLFKKRIIGNLATGRDSKLPDRDKQIKDSNNFELVTWLVIKKK